MAKSNKTHQQQNHLSSISAPSPTTFVQTDPSSFKSLVQKLTGVPKNSQEKLKLPISGKPNSNPEAGARRSPFKLQERRKSMRKLELELGLSRNTGKLKGEMLGSSSLHSPVTPLVLDPFESGVYSPGSTGSCSDLNEERAIAEKGFYLHPSPLNTPRKGEPELLCLFPLHSCKEMGSGCS